ncbi:hypothetical protein ACLMJK_006912 [Lecanora helva]
MDSGKADNQEDGIAEKPITPEVSITKRNESDNESTKSSLRQIQSIGVPEDDFKPSKKLYIAFTTLAVITLMVALDGTSLSVALPIVAQKLKGTAIEAFWSGTSFLLCSTVFQPSFASFSHIFGRRQTIMVALLFFLIGAIIASVANNFGVLLVGRSLQGIGGGGLIALTEIVVTDLIPLRFRGDWFGIISGMWSIGSVTGPIVGGAFAQKATWRWIFYLNFPFVVIAMILVPITLRLNFKQTNLGSQLRRVDWIGSVLFIGSTTSFLIPVTWGGVSYAWDSWRTLVPLLVGVAGLVAFVLFEELVAKEPLIRMDIFKNRTNAASYFSLSLHGMILWSMLYYLPLYYEAVKGETAIVAGVSLFPQTFTVAPAAVVTGILIGRIGKYRWAIWIGWILTTLGVGLLCYLKVDTPTVSWIFLNLVSGLGMGMLFPAMTFPVQAATASKDVAFAVALYSFFRAFGQAIGVAIGGTIFQNEMKKKLLTYPLLAPQATEYSKDASSLVQIIKAMAPGQARTELIQGYTDSLQIVWAVMTGLAFLGFATSLLIQELDMNRALDTEQGMKREKTKEQGEVEKK